MQAFSEDSPEQQQRSQRTNTYFTESERSTSSERVRVSFEQSRRSFTAVNTNLNQVREANVEPTSPSPQLATAPDVTVADVHDEVHGTILSLDSKRF